MHPPAIDVVPGFVPNPQFLFDGLMASVQWESNMRARKTASFGAPYNYAQMTYPATAMPAELDALCARIEIRLGFRPNNCLLNHYPDGNASIGFHSDETEQLEAGTGVAIVSLGWPRSIAYRHKQQRDIEFTYPLESGSLLYMSDAVQEIWLHAIPKQAEAGERISLTFRRLRSG